MSRYKSQVITIDSNARGRWKLSSVSTVNCAFKKFEIITRNKYPAQMQMIDPNANRGFAGNSFSNQDCSIESGAEADRKEEGTMAAIYSAIVGSTLVSGGAIPRLVRKYVAKLASQWLPE